MLAEQSKRKWFTLRNTSCLSRIEFDRSSCWSAVLQFYVHRKDNKRLSLTPILSQIQAFQWGVKVTAMLMLYNSSHAKSQNQWTLSMCCLQYRDNRTDTSINGKSGGIFILISYLNRVGPGTPSIWRIYVSCQLWAASRKQTLGSNCIQDKFDPDSPLHCRLA